MIYYTTWDKPRDLGELYKEWTGKIYDSQFLLTNSHFVAAKEKDTNKLVGVAQFIIINDPFWRRRWGLVENVFVSEAYRGCGIGSGLMREIEFQARLFDCIFIKLTTNKPGVAEFYRSLGYTEGASFGKDVNE